MKDLVGINISEIKEEIAKLGLKPFAASQIFSWIHQKGLRDFMQMTNLSKENRELLAGNFFLSVLETAKVQKSKDGTQKILYKLMDGKLIESVIMSADGGDEGRKTVCVSTQVGCPLECGFCATGKSGFERNLTAAEIVNQVPVDVSNVVFMGMGEPFLNYDNLMRAIRILNAQEGLNIGARKITVSTAGIPDKIVRFAKEGLQVRLAISLNATQDELRSKLMPINQKHPLKEVIGALKQYFKITGRRITFEYIMLKKINDNLEDAVELVQLCDQAKANVNLIALNPHEGCAYEPSSPKCISAFKEELFKNGIETIIRFRRGVDINAACGQLKRKT